MTYRVVGGYHGESRMMEEYIYIHSCPHYDRCASSIRLADASLLGDAGQVCRDVHAHAHWKLEKYVFFGFQFMRYSDHVIRSLLSLLTRRCIMV